MIKKLHQGKMFYGWFIVAASFIVMVSSMGIVNNTSSLFLKPISDDLGFTRSAISATLTVRSITQMMVALFSGKIFSKYNLKNVMKLSTIILVISYFSYSLVSSLALFYIITIIVSFTFSLISMLPLGLILSNWFYERIGMVIGIAFMGSGIGGMLFNTLAGKWILAYGWRNTYQILALIIFFTVTPCIFFVIKIHPKDVGLKPFGYSSESNSNLLSQNEGIMLQEATKTNKFWALIICSILLAMSLNTLMMTVSPHLTDIGYSITYSANIVALCMGAIAVGKLLLGYLYDRLGVKISTVIAGISTMIGVVSLINFKSNLSIVILIFGSGIGCAYGTVGPPIIARSLYGRRDYSAIYGVVFAANSIGSALGPLLNGYIYDLTGSYLFGFKLMLVVSLLTIFAYLIVLPRGGNESIKIKTNIN